MLNRVRLSQAENLRRIEEILAKYTGKDYYRARGDELVKAYLRGEIDEIPGTAWYRRQEELLP